MFSRGQLAIFIDVVGGLVGVGRLNQRRVYFCFADVDIGLPAVIRDGLTRILSFDVVDGGQVVVTALVVNRNCRCFIERSRIIPVKPRGNNLRVGRQV